MDHVGFSYVDRHSKKRKPGPNLYIEIDVVKSIPRIPKFSQNSKDKSLGCQMGSLELRVFFQNTSNYAKIVFSMRSVNIKLWEFSQFNVLIVDTF